MRLASLASLGQEAKSTFLRFPAVLLCGLGAAWLAIDLINEKGDAPQGMLRTLLVLILGIPLFLAIALVLEKPPRRPVQPVARWAAWAAVASGVAVLLVYRHLLGREAGEAALLRYVQINLAVQLGVAIAPFLGRGEENGFWQFNRRLFLRFFLSGIYAAVFFGGLALAILAVDRLFDVKVNSVIYPRLWFLTVFLFFPWHFLAGVPRDLRALDADTEHPRGLRRFAQYMLVPLVLLYLTILFVYTAKILVTRQWPQGWVGWLVSFASLFGVLTVLLLQPGRPESEHRWTDRFARGFFIAILPLLGVLFAALGKRVGQYGWTEKRYWLGILGTWLAGIALFMLARRTRHLKAIPATLALTALVTAFGPWGAYAVSERSQSARLEALLERHGLLSGGRLTRATGTVAPDDIREISAAVDYLSSAHGGMSLARWSGKAQTIARPALFEGGNDMAWRNAFLDEMGLEYLAPWETATEEGQYHTGEEWRDVTGYERLYEAYFYRDTPMMAVGRYWARFDAGGHTVEILNGPTVMVSMPLQPLLDRLATVSGRTATGLPAHDLCVAGETPRLRARVCFVDLSTRKEEGETGRAAWTGNGYFLIDDHP